jgi:subtilase family serine protease
MKVRLITLSLVIALIGSFAFSRPASAEVRQVQGAIGLVNVLANLNDTIDVGDVEIIDSSFNNLRALNNVLNNSPFLNDLDINVLTIEDVLNDLTIRDVLQNFLNENDIDVTVEDFLNDNAIGIAVLSGGVVLFN